jgi:tRNA pseudouridine55 synthase
MNQALQSGFLVIDKPEGMTSHDVVQAIRRRLGIRKVGHLGTLDPMATGVLPLALGKATRLAQFLSGGQKIYEGTIRFGFSTNTFDREGEPTSAPVVPAFTTDQLEEAGKQLVGEQLQTPPPFSAKKIGGIRSYHLARQGQKVTMPPQRICISRLDLFRREVNEAAFEIRCSAGTYVRSVAHDLGTKLGCGAHLLSLRRLASGEFHLDRAVKLSIVMNSSWPDWLSQVIPMNTVLRNLPELTVGPEIQDHLVHGRDFNYPAGLLGPTSNTLVRLMSPGGELLGIAELLPAQSTRDLVVKTRSAYYHPKVIL